MIRKLAGQTAIYGLSTIVPRLINYLLAPYLTYYALNTEEFGVMGYFYATIPFGLSLLTMGMENAFFKFTGKYESAKEKRDVYNTSLSFVICLCALFLTAIYLFQDNIYSLISMNFAKEIIMLSALIIVVDTINALPFARLREEQRSIKFTVLKAVSVLINVTFVIFFYTVLPLIKENPSFEWLWIENFGAGYVFVANLIASTATLIFLYLTYLDFRFRINLKLLKTILIFSIPLFISGFSGTANEFIDRQMMAILIPESKALSEIGIYTATLKIASLMVIFTQMYRYAAEPLFLSKMKKEDFKENNAEVTKFFVISSLTIFLFITLYIDIFEKFVGSDFRGGINLIPILLIANILLGLQLNLSFWYKFIEKTHFALTITIIGLSVNIGFNMIFMSSMGYTSAAIAKMLSMLSMVAYSYYLNQKHYPIKYDLKRILEYSLLTFVLFAMGNNIKLDSWILDNTLNTALLLSFVIWVSYREKILKRIKK